MAAWLKPFGIALLAALSLHALSLLGIASHLHTASSVLKPVSEPLFTRTIEAASAPDLRPAAHAVAHPAPPMPRSNAVVQIVANPPSAPIQPTETLALAATPSALPAASSSVADALMTATSPAISEIPTSTAAISTSPTQSLSSQPSAQSDTLLATGQWPADTRVSYVMTGHFNGPLHGTGQVQWTRTGPAADRYQVRVVVDAGLMQLSVTSQGRVSPQGLLPEAFEEHVKTIGRSPRIRPLKLEADELVLADGRRIPRPLQDPLSVQDSVSQFVELGHRISQGRSKLEAGQVMRIWLGRPGGLDEWIYDVREPETLTLPRIGAVQVFPLQPRPLVNARGTISMRMWLAPSLQYLPAKIRIDLNAQAHIELQAELLEQH
jgi:hypothetical protein